LPTSPSSIDAPLPIALQAVPQPLHGVLAVILEQDLDDVVHGIGIQLWTFEFSGYFLHAGRATAGGTHGFSPGDETGHQKGVISVEVELVLDPAVDGGGRELPHQDVPVVEVGVRRAVGVF
jgi:hypothetical protein